MLKKFIIPFFIIAILGTLGHFVYEFSGRNYIAGLFFPVNESTWEHLKLLFYPTILYTVFEYFKSKEKSKNYIPASVISLFCGMLSIIILFYTYTGVLGKNIGLLDIAIYYISIIVMLCTKRKLLKSEKFSADLWNPIFITLILILILLFSFWSYNPPKWEIFIIPDL